VGQADPLTGGVEQAAADVNLVGLAQRVADAMVLGGQEGKAHSPADHQSVDGVEQGLDHLQLVADLGPAEDGGERPLRRLPQA
jgi:hypothetical protein